MRLFLIISMMFLSTSSFAQSHGSFSKNSMNSRQWNLTLGGGVAVMPKYSGSDELKQMHFPLIDAEYSVAHFTLFYSMDRGGIKFFETDYLSLSMGFSLGENRRTDEIRYFEGEKNSKDLIGTPKIYNRIRYYGSATMPFSEGKFSASTYLAPIDAKYDEVERQDNSYDGILLSFDYNYAWNLGPKLIVSLTTSTNWMNTEYAQAYYSVNYATTHLNIYQASSGFKDVSTIATVSYQLNKSFGVLLMSTATYLLNDAAQSPISENDWQASLATAVFYQF